MEKLNSIGGMRKGELTIFASGQSKATRYGYTMISRNLIEKIRVGAAITDDELDAAIEFYSPLEASLSKLGQRFHHPWVEIRGTLDRLKSYKESRVAHGEKKLL